MRAAKAGFIMANISLFQSLRGVLMPRPDVQNAHGAPAYSLEAKHALAQYAATGCLSQTFYASAETQLEDVLKLAMQVEPEFVAKLALYARTRGLMKDMPALLCAVLAVRDTRLLTQVFPQVIDNGKMLRNFVQIVRSGVTGRKSLGTRPKRLVLDWFATRDVDAIFRQSVGTSPSLADVIKMVHPTPDDDARRALYAYLIGKPYDLAKLPALVRDYEAFKRGDLPNVPDVPFQMLTSLTLTREHWASIATQASWQMTRMNLNTFARHGVFDLPRMPQLVATRLADRSEVRKAKAFPYQLLAAYQAAAKTLPPVVAEALQDALEHATSNVPELKGKVYVLVDVSGSMSSPVTGVREGASSAVRCIDVAALVAACLLRKNPTAEVIPFEQDVVKDFHLNPRDSVMTNAQKLAAIGGGGTSCSAPLRLLNQQKKRADLVIYVSDNESWVDARRHGATAVMNEWASLKKRSPDAKLVCIDVVPNKSTQAKEEKDILNIGGFSDAVFDLVSAFARGRLGADHWVGEIEKLSLG